MNNIKEKLKNPKQYIPIGKYCYDKNGTCPFWSVNEDKPIQENGYCHYLQKGDWDINAEGGTIIDCKTGEKHEVDYYPFGGLIWDMCKECEVKDYNLWCLDCKYCGDLMGYNCVCLKKNKIVIAENGCDEFEVGEEG